MAETVIGGHLGMAVTRVEGFDINWISKRALHDLQNSGPDVGIDLYDHNADALKNEARMLDLMEGSGYSPRVLAAVEGMIDQDDLGDTEAPTDPELWRRNCVKMLAEIRARGLRHGDLVGSNIITRGNHPYAIDWQEGHLLTEPAPQKQPWSDSALLMRHIAGTYGPDGQLDTPRVARRWGAVLGALGADRDFTLPLKGKTFLDLGCFQGDFVALAAAEGMDALGIDQGGFRSGENSIEIGRSTWNEFPFGHVGLSNGNIVDYVESGLARSWDVVVMFSTWPYIVKDFTHQTAMSLLHRIIASNEVLFFETQLAGDGPGPEFLRNDSDVKSMLHGLGATQVGERGTFPVTGRPASRTVWEVRK